METLRLMAITVSYSCQVLVQMISANTDVQLKACGGALAGLVWRVLDHAADVFIPSADTGVLVT
jgi:hypothetical protein